MTERFLNSGTDPFMIDQFDDAARTIVLNPVLSSENFADKWSRKPERRSAFFEWHTQLIDDLKLFGQADRFKGIATSLESLLCEKPKGTAFAQHAKVLQNMLGRQSLGVTIGTATLAATSSGVRAMPAHTNFGCDVL